MKKVISIFLSAVLMFSVFAVAVSAQDLNCDCEYAPTVVIPGLMQSSTYMYNEDGTVNENYDAPFFMDDSDSIVKTAFSKVLSPLLSTLLTQSDADGKFSTALAETVSGVIGEKIKSDANGKTVYNVDAVHYPGSFAECSTTEQLHILGAIPMEQYMEVAGEDHFYFFSYNSFGNLDAITAELYELIQKVIRETGHEKINIVPISQGGTVCNNLLEYYPDVMNQIDRLIYVVPALDGTSIISDIYKNGFIDDNDALYGYMLPMLLDDEFTGNAVNLALRLLPESVLQETLDKTVDVLVEDYLEYCTCMWAFVKAEDYEEAADKYLSDPEDAEIRRQTDAYQQARLDSDENILKAIECGVEVFNAVNYNYALYPIVDSWNKKNADGIIDLDSTSMGAYSLGVDVTLPEGYTQQGNDYGTCADPSHDHIDPYGIVDASTGLLPDSTFYFYNGDHEQTGDNDVLIGLISRLLVDDSFTDVYSYPEIYPQFNEARDGTHMEVVLGSAEVFLMDKADDEYPELRQAMASVEALLDETVVDYDETVAATEKLENALAVAKGESEEESFLTKILTKIVDSLTKAVESKYGYHSYSGK